MFFNVFVLFQIFNQFNVRQLSFKKLNSFEGLIEKPLFLAFITGTLIMQLGVMTIGSSILHITELTYRQNLLCFVIGSISLYANYVVKVAMPSHFAISKDAL